MKSLDELKKIKENALKKMNEYKENDGYRIVVGMATCGIAAGAKPVMDTLVEELKKRSIDNVKVIMTGCIGVCRLEPMIEVFDSSGEKTTYVNMDPEKAVNVITRHIVNGKPVLDYVIGNADK